MWMARIAAFFGGPIFRTALRFVIIPAALIGFGYFGINKVAKVLHQSSQYEAMQTQLNEANEALAAKDEEHAAELARLEADRIAFKEHHVEFERAAIRENSQLKKALENNEENKIWHDAAIPDDIRRLREQSKTTNAIPSELEGSTSTN